MNAFAVAPAHELHIKHCGGRGSLFFQCPQGAASKVFPSPVPKLSIKQEKCVFLQFLSTTWNTFLLTLVPQGKYRCAIKYLFPAFFTDDRNTLDRH